MPSTLKKSPLRCPKCDFVQLEPPHVVSTCCRACGLFYEVPRPGAAPKAASLPSALRIPLVVSRPARPVFCHRCGTTHHVTDHARSTICPGCQAAIELTDLEFADSASRSVDTRGHLLVGPSAHLSHSWIVCGSCRIEGRISGLLRAEREVVLASSHDLACQILAPRVVIDRHHRGSIHPEIETDELVVRGTLQAAVRCRGRVHVTRTGSLTGTLVARAVCVDRGGRLSAACTVDVRQPAVLPRTEALAPGRLFGPLAPQQPHAA